MKSPIASTKNQSAVNAKGVASLLMLAFAWLVTLAAHFAGVAPLGLVILLALTLLTALAALSGELRTIFGALARSPAAWLLTAASLYILISSLWSARASEPLTALAHVAPLALTALLAPWLVARTDDLNLHRAARGLLTGIILGGLFTAFELYSERALLGWIGQQFPGSIKLSGPDMVVLKSYLNKNAALLVLFGWSALLAARYWPRPKLRPLLIGVLCLLILAVLLQTESRTAQLAFIGGLLAFVLTALLPRIAGWLIAACWLVAVAFVVPLVLLVTAAELQHDPSLERNARARLHIWSYTANKATQNLLTGIGIRSDRYNEEGKPPADNMLRERMVDFKGWHPHNIYLQVWHELGAVGAALLLAIGLLLIRRIERIERAFRPYAYAAFASFSIIGGLGWGMWQSWLLASEVWAIIFVLLAVEYARRATR